MAKFWFFVVLILSYLYYANLRIQSEYRNTLNTLFLRSVQLHKKNQKENIALGIIHLVLHKIFKKSNIFYPLKKKIVFGKLCARTKWTISCRKMLINPQFPIDCRSKQRSCSSKKTVLKNFTKFTRKHTCRSFFFQPQVWTLLKKRLRRGRLFVNILWSF